MAILYAGQESIRLRGTCGAVVKHSIVAKWHPNAMFVFTKRTRNKTYMAFERVLRSDLRGEKQTKPVRPIYSLRIVGDLYWVLLNSLNGASGMKYFRLNRLRLIQNHNGVDAF